MASTGGWYGDLGGHTDYITLQLIRGMHENLLKQD